MEELVFLTSHTFFQVKMNIDHEPKMLQVQEKKSK
jgi:hypothetical protein